MSIRWFGCRNENGPNFVRDRATHELGFAFCSYLSSTRPALIISNGNLPGIGAYTSTMGDAARRHLLNSRALDAHFRRNRGDLREIHLHITDRL